MRVELVHPMHVWFNFYSKYHLACFLCSKRDSLCLLGTIWKWWSGFLGQAQTSRLRGEIAVQVGYICAIRRFCGREQKNCFILWLLARYFFHAKKKKKNLFSLIKRISILYRKGRKARFLSPMVTDIHGVQNIHSILHEHSWRHFKIATSKIHA